MKFGVINLFSMFFPDLFSDFFRQALNIFSIFCICIQDGSNEPAEKKNKSGKKSTGSKDESTAGSSSGNTSRIETGNDGLYDGIVEGENEDEETGDDATTDTSGLPSYCSRSATRSEVRKKVEEYAETLFPGAPFAKSVLFLSSCVPVARGQSKEIGIHFDTNGFPGTRICPFCLELLDCGPGLHFRVKGRPLNVLWLSAGEWTGRGTSWDYARGEVVRMAASFRVIRDFVEHFESSPLAVALQNIRNRQVSSDFEVLDARYKMSTSCWMTVFLSWLFGLCFQLFFFTPSCCTQKKVLFFFPFV